MTGGTTGERDIAIAVRPIREIEEVSSIPIAFEVETQSTNVPACRSHAANGCTLAPLRIEFPARSD